MKINKKVLVTGSVLLLIYASGFLVRNHFGISVIVKNSTEDSLRNARIIVKPRGATYELAELPAGTKKRMWIEPAGESGVWIEFIDGRNQKKSEIIAGYLESGYCGNIKVNITSGKVVTREDVDPAFCTASWEDFL